MINKETFIKWAEKHFPTVETHNDEIKVDSIFTQDTKQHLWCNVKKNAYHCWKTNESGNLYQLISKVSGCSYKEAADLLGYSDLSLLESRLEKYYSDKEIKPKPEPKIKFPPNTFEIKTMVGSFRHRAENYITSRHLSVGNMLFCLSGKYKDRIVIPYYDKDNTLIYWNARDITNKAKMKYMGPDADEVNVGKSDVLFAEYWPKTNEMVYLTEGEFDAMSINKSGLCAMACGGKEISFNQIDILKPYRVCICFDNDKSGAEALNKMGDKLIGNGIQDVSYIRPPVNIKDWNQMLCTIGADTIKSYISDKRQSFNLWTSNFLRADKI